MLEHLENLYFQREKNLKENRMLSGQVYKNKKFLVFLSKMAIMGFILNFRNMVMKPRHVFHNVDYT